MITTGTYCPIYRTLRDHGDGRYVKGCRFERIDATETHLNDLGLATHQDLDGGFLGTVRVPEGSVLAETESGGMILVLPGSTIGLDASEVLSCAKDGREGLRMVTR